MKKLLFFSWLICAAMFVNGQETSKVEVYYFHLNNRCATCKAIENVTTLTLKNNFATQMKSGQIVFKSVNIEKKASKALVKKLKVKGQSLVLYRGDKKTDLTTLGFQYARTKPKEFEEIIIKEIKQLLK